MITESRSTCSTTGNRSYRHSPILRISVSCRNVIRSFVNYELLIVVAVVSILNGERLVDSQ
jgi:hypothetical protein